MNNPIHSNDPPKEAKRKPRRETDRPVPRRMRNQGLPELQVTPSQRAIAFGISFFMAFFPFESTVLAVLPTGPEIIHGDVNIGSDGIVMAIDQSTEAAIINWQGFSIGLDNAVNVNQPDAFATMLSRVIGNDVSDILGSLTATGHFYLVNPNGIFFGPDATIDTNALIASTLDISDSDFLAGSNIFAGESEASIINESIISADDFVTLIAKYVENIGTIEVKGGSVGIAARETVLQLDSVYGGGITIDISGISGDAINSGVIDVSAENTDGDGGAIIMEGDRVGQFGMAVSDADGKGRGGYIEFNADTAVSLSGESVTSANADSEGDGGTVIAYSEGSAFFRPGASIEVKGGSEAGDGGFAEMSGIQHVEIHGRVDATAPAGEVGEFLIDPGDVDVGDFGNNTNIDEVGDDFQPSSGAASGNLDVEELKANLQTASVTVSTTNNGVDGGATGIITISAGINDAGSAGNTRTLTFDADDEIRIASPITAVATGVLNIIFDAINFVRHQAGSNITTNGGNVTYLPPVVFEANALVNTDNPGAVAGNVNFQDTVSGNFNLSLSANGSTNGNIDFDGVVSNIGNLAITFANNVTFDDALDADVITVALVTGALQFDGAVTANASFNVTAENINVNDDLTTADGVGASLTSGAAGTTAVSAATTIDIGSTGTGGTTGSLTFGGGTLQTAGDVTAAEDINVNIPAELTGNASFTAAGGNLSFNNTVNDDGAGGADNLNVSATGTIQFGDTLGGTDRLGTLAIDTSGGTVNPTSVTFTNPVTATSITRDGGTGTNTFVSTVNVNNGAGIGIDLDGADFTFQDTVTDTSTGGVRITNTSTLDVSGSFNLSGGPFVQDGAGLSDVGADISTTNDGISFDGSVTFSSASNLSSGGAGIDIGDSTADMVTVNALTTVDTDNATVNVNGNLSLGANLSIDSVNGVNGGAVNFVGTVDGGNLLTVDLADGTATFSDVVGGGATVDGIAIISAGQVDFNNTLRVGTQNVDINAATVNFNDAVTTVTNGTVTITNTGTLTIQNDADFNLDGAFLQDGAGGVSLGAVDDASGLSISTTNDLVQFDGPVGLLANTTVDAGSGGITINGFLDGNFGVVLNTSGTTILAGVIGGGTPIASITTDDGVGLDVTEIRANISGQGTTMTFNDNVELTGGSVTLTDTGGTVVSFGGTVNGAQDLTLAVSGTTTFSSAVGDSTPLGDGGGAAITLDSTGPTNFDSTVATASGIAQADTAGAVTFDQNVDIVGGDTNTTFDANVVLDGLTFTSDGTIIFGNGVGGDTLTISSALVTVDTSTPGSLVDLNAATTLNAGLTVTTGAAGITLDGTIQGANDLTLNTSGTTDINAEIGGGGSPIASITTDLAGLGTTEVSADITASGGTMTFNDPVVLTGATTFTDTGGIGVSFNSTVNGGNDLTLAVDGSTTFADTVGNSAPIGAGPGAGITINSAGTTDFQNTVATASGFDQADAAGAISFLTDVNVGAGGTANTFNADVVLDGLTFTTAVDLTFGSDSLDNLTLSTGSVTLDAGGNNITLNSETDGNQPFVLNSTVTTDINGAIGASTPVSTLTTNAGGTTDLGADISTQGGTITFGDPVVLSADITLTDTGTTGVTFSDTISGAQILNILATTATVQFDGNVGAPTRLNNLDVDADTINVNAGIDAVTVSLSTDNVALSGGAGSITGNDGGTLSIAPLTDARTIGIGNLSTGLLNIDSSEIATIADNGFTSLTFGSLTGSGAVDVEAVTFNDPVTIQSPGGAIGIQGALTGDDEATVTVDGGTIDVDAAVTTTDAPGGGGAITLSAESGLNVDGNVITVNSAAIVLDGDASDDGTGDLLVSQAVGVVITGDAGSGNVDLEGENVTLGDGGANNVAVFGNTINVLADKDDSLVTPGGDFTLNAGSSINALDALTIGTPGNTAQNVIISGTLDAANGLTVRADDALTVNANITTTNNSAITLDADSDDSGVGDLTIASTADVAVDSVEGNMTLEGENITLGGAFNATITGGNTKITANKFGAGTGDFTLNDGSSITANLTVGDATVDVDDPFDVTVSGTMTSDGAITFSAENDITVTASADVSSTSSSVTFTSDTDNNGNATISVAPLTTGDITGSTVTFTSGSGANNDVTLNDIINNTSGGITFGDNLDEVNLNTDLSSDGRIDFGATIVNLALATVINADVSALDAANDVDLGSADLVGGANDLNLDAGTGDVFLGTLSTTGNLVIDDADNLELTGGGGTGIVSIVNAFSDGGLLANLPAGDVIRVSGNATVNTNTNLIDLVTGNIRAINGAAPGGTLTLSSGGSNITLHQVGQATAVGGLTADAGGAAITLMADIRTTGTQDYRNGDVDIDAGVDLLANVSGNILMNTGVTSIEFTDAAAGTNTINAAGSVNFGTTLTDSLAGPATVTVDAGNNITVSGATFDGASITTLDLDVGNTGAGTLFFQTAAVTVDSIDVDGTGADDAVDIDQNLTSTNAAGTGIDIAGVSTVDVAEITDLISDNVLNINAPGGINLSGGNGTTNLFDSDNDVALTLTGPVTAGNNVNLTLDSEGAITVNSAVDINLGTFIMNVDVNDDGVVIGQLGGDVDAGVVTIIQTAVAPNDTLDVDGSITAATGVVAIQNFDIVDIAANQSVQSTNDSVTIDHSAATTATRVTFNDGASASAGTTLDVNNTALLELGSSASITANNGELDLRTGVTVTNLTGAAGPANAVLLDGNGADNNVLISDVDSATANEADLTVNSDGNFDFGGVAGNVDLSAGVGTGGTLTVNVDVNNNGSIILDMTVGTFDLGGLSVSGTSGNDDFDLAVLTTQNPAADVDVDDFLTADFSGNLTSAGGINLTNIPNVNILTGVPDTDITFDAQGGDLNMFSGIGTINLDDNDDIRTVTLQTSGVATNTNVTLGAIDGDPGAAGTDQNLTVAATSAVDLQGTITNVDTLDVSADTDNNESLLLAGTPGISVGGSITTTAGPVTLGGAVVQSNDDVDIDASVSAFTDLTIRNAGVSDLDGNANLTANGGNLVATNVVSLNLSGGSPTTNTLTAQGAGGSNIDLTNTLVTASSPDTVTFTSENGITLNTVSVGTNTTVVIDLDTNAGGATLTVDDITAGALDVDGTGVDDDMNFNGFINTTGFTGAANGSVAIDNAATVDFQGAAATDDVTAGLSVVIGNTTTLTLADNIDITASAGDLDLSGVGTLTIPAAGTNVLSADGDASTITVPDTTGTGASLTVTSEGDINFTGGGLDIGATAALSATVDDNASGGVETLTVGQTLDAGSIALSGTGTNDTIDINSNLTADATDVTVQNAATVEIDTGLTVLAATNVDVSTGVTSIDLTDDPGVAVDVTFTGTGGTVSLANIDDNAASTVDNLNVNAGTTATLGSVTLDDAGTGNATVDANTSTVLNGAINIDGLLTVGVGDDGTAALNNAVINADGGAVFSGLVDGNAVSLGAGVTITTVDTLIHFVGSNINNGQTLSLQAGGGGVSLVELANVGNATPLTSLNVDAVDVELGGSIAATGLIDIDETGADGISTAGSITSSGDDVQINTGGPFGFADDNISGVEVAITAALEITNNLGIITASAATATAMALSGQEIGSFIGSPIEIALTGDGELTLTTPTQTGANTGDIFITSDSNNILLGVITVDANAADLDVDIRTTTTGNISLANASTATVDVDLVLNAAGTLTVANLGGGAELTFGTYDIDAAGVNIAGEIVSLSNTVDIDSTATVSVAGTITSNGAVTIDTVGVTSDVDISVTGTVETAAGNDDLSVRSVTIGGGTGVGRNVIISGTVQTGNATSSAPLADVTSGGITIANVSGTVSGGGTLTTGSADESGNANVTALSGSVSITTTGPVATIQNDKFNCAYERWCYVLSLLCVH